MVQEFWNIFACNFLNDGPLAQLKFSEYHSHALTFLHSHVITVSL